MASLSKLDLIETAATVYDKLIGGESDTDIMSAMRMDAKTYDEVKRFLFDSKAEKYRTATREQNFVEYVTAQRAIQKKVKGYLESVSDPGKQLGSIVGALRLCSDIEERIIARGQEFGVFKKTAERRELVAGLVVADMSTADLTKAISKHHKTFEDLVAKFGEGDMLALPAKPLHYGESAFDVPGEAVEEDDEAMLPPARPERSKKGGKRSGGRSGKHAGYREPRADAE